MAANGVFIGLSASTLTRSCKYTFNKSTTTRPVAPKNRLECFCGFFLTHVLQVIINDCLIAVGVGDAVECAASFIT
jgi:hypothetical protein